MRPYWVHTKKSPVFRTGFSHFNSLTMSYFHTGIRTIIGAEAFHCPVRDGKEWYHFAMVVRHNFFATLTKSRRPIYRANQLVDFTTLLAQLF